MINIPPNAITSFRFIDIFSGIGGFRIALQRVGGLSVFSSDIDKSAKQTYLNNYGELPFGDIRDFTSESIPDHEVLAAGFPCQPFSHAGKKKGFKCATQGTLFFDIVRIASVKKPKVLFLENVRSIVLHDHGRTFQIIEESVKDIGYRFQYAIIDSSTVVPQRRVRCYIVCFRNDLNVDFKFPSFEGERLPLRSILEKNVSDKFTISDKLWQGHINRTNRNLKRGTGFTAFTANLDKPSNTLVARYGKDGKECLIPQKDKNPRMLTPLECARLQGFPDTFIIAIAKTSAYKQFGNSVVIPVVSKISEEIAQLI